MFPPENQPSKGSRHTFSLFSFFLLSSSVFRGEGVLDPLTGHSSSESFFHCRSFFSFLQRCGSGRCVVVVVVCLGFSAVASRLAVSGHRAKPHPAFPPFPGFLSRSPPLFSRLLSPSAILFAIHPSPHRLFSCVLPTCRIPPDLVHPESRIALFIFIEVL